MKKKQFHKNENRKHDTMRRKEQEQWISAWKTWLTALQSGAVHLLLYQTNIMTDRTAVTVTNRQLNTNTKNPPPLLSTLLQLADFIFRSYSNLGTSAARCFPGYYDNHVRSGTYSFSKWINNKYINLQNIVKMRHNHNSLACHQKVTIKSSQLSLSFRIQDFGCSVKLYQRFPDISN